MTINAQLIEGLVKTKNELNSIKINIDEAIKDIVILLEKNEQAINYTHISKPENIKQVTIKEFLDESEAIKHFPNLARKDKQLVWLFENYLTQACKLTEIQGVYDRFSVKKARIDNVARRLKKEGKLVVVKYNGANNLSFWGLPKWIERNDFADNYKPSKNQLPFKINNKEIVKK